MHMCTYIPRQYPPFIIITHIQIITNTLYRYISQMSTQQKQIEETKAHNVQIKVIDNKLHIMINPTNDINVSYFAQISALTQFQDLSQSFDTLDQLTDYLMLGNYQVDLLGGFLEIIARVSTGKNKAIVIAKIPLTTRKPDIATSLKQIQQQCLKNPNLSPTQLQTRQYLSKMSQILIQHIQQQNNQSKASIRSSPSQQPINVQQGVKIKQQIQSVFQSKINIINDNFNRKIQQLRELMMRKMGAVDRQIEGLKAKIVESRRESRGNGDLRVVGADTDNLALEARIDFIENDISTLVDRISEMNRNIYEFARNLRQKKPKQQKTHPSQPTSMPTMISMPIQSPTPSSPSSSPPDIKSWLQQKNLPESVTIGPGNMIQSKNEAVSISSKVVINRKYKYSISVRKINEIISVGIIDLKFIHAANTTGSAFLYCSDGRYYDGYQYVLPKTNVGFEFGKGDRVFVDVDLEKGEIKWSFRGEQKLCIFNQKLRNKQTRWVAYIKLSGMCSILVFP